MCKRHLAVCFLIETGGFFYFQKKVEKFLLRGGAKRLAQFKQVKGLIPNHKIGSLSLEL